MNAWNEEYLYDEASGPPDPKTKTRRRRSDEWLDETSRLNLAGARALRYTARSLTRMKTDNFGSLEASDVGQRLLPLLVRHDGCIWELGTIKFTQHKYGGWWLSDARKPNGDTLDTSGRSASLLRARETSRIPHSLDSVSISAGFGDMPQPYAVMIEQNDWIGNAHLVQEAKKWAEIG